MTLGRISSIAGGLVVAVLLTTSRPAHAYSTFVKPGCTITQVGFDQHILVQCSGDTNNYFSYQTADKPNCTATTNVTIDTLKIWHSMLMSAFLSGRKVDLYIVTNPSPTQCADTTTQFIFNIGIK